MLQSPLRPFVPLSALALLGWCWYTFSKNRKLCKRATEEWLVCSPDRRQSVAENITVQEVSADRNTAAEQDVKTQCNFQSQEEQEGDENADRNCSRLGSTKDESSVLTSLSCTTGLTSTPVVQHAKGIRPEPEGEVSRAQASLLLAEKPETELGKEETAVKGHLDFKEIETESFALQPAGIVCSQEHDVTNVSDKQSERVPTLNEATTLVVEVINSVTEEIVPIAGGILKGKGLVETRLSPQSQAIPQEEIAESSVVTRNDPALSHTVEESVSLAHKPGDTSSTLTGKDSGCSTCLSDDGLEVEKAASKSQAVETTSSAVLSSEIHHTTARKNGKLLRQKTDAAKDANGVKRVNGKNRVASKRAAQATSSPHTVWNVEVPAHLVGRLIGKKGNYINTLKQSSGAKVHVSTLPYTYDFQICHVEGSKVQVESALALIRKKFKDLDLSNCLSSSQPAPLHSLPFTSWLLLPQDGTVEVIVPRVEAANELFVQQHAHPTYYGLHSLTQQMLFCYGNSGCPSLPYPVEAGVLCAAPSPDGAWWRAQVIQHYKDSSIVQIRYVDYGGYMTVDLASLKQIRSDFVTLPFQASEVILEGVAPLPGQEKFSVEAKEALEELTQGIPLIMKVTGSQSGLPLVHMWRHTGEQMVSVNGVLVERGLCSWLNSR